jgi:hypothetical protein
MRHKRLPASGGEGGHPGCVRVELVFEEDGEIGFDYVAEEDGSGHSGGMVIAMI